MAQPEIRSLTPDHRVLADGQIGCANFIVLNKYMVEAETGVVVSSDDNHFTARGGVAKALRGPEVEGEIERLSLNRFRQAQIAITTGGAGKGEPYCGH